MKSTNKNKSKATPRSKQALLQEIEELKSRMEEQEETLRAIRDGEVDALMVSTPEGEKVFTLKGAEQVYRIFIETMHEGALLLYPAGTVLYANTRFAEMVSMPLEGIINSPLDRYMRASDRAGFKGLLEEGMREQASGEITLRRGRGQYLAARISVAPFAMEGKPCVCAVVTDISEIQKYLEIIEAGKLVQTVIEQSTDCIIVCDTQGIIHASSSSSSSSSSIHRYYSGRVRSKKLDDVLPLHYTSSRSGRSALFSTAEILRGKRVSNEEVTYQKSSGERVHFLLNARPLYDKQKKIIGCLVILTDITERKQAEKALRESEQLYRAIGESIDYGVWVCAPDGRNTYASQSFLDMVGLTQQQCSDFGWGDVLHPDDSERTIAAWQDCVRTGGTWDIEHRFRGADGEWHPVLARGVPVRDEQGNITNWAGINLDISRLKETEKALLRSNQRFELLAETASRLLGAEQPQQIVEDICRKVMVYLDCHAFFNFLADEAAGRLHLNACAGIPAEEARKIEWLDYGVAVCGCAAAEGRRIVAENIFTTPDPRTELVKSYGIQAYACHPITGADERIIGTLSFGTRNRPTFTAEELELMKTVADQVAIAMERKQTGEKISQLNRELKHTVEELEAVFDTVPIGIAIAEDPQGYHIRGNPANEQLLGVMHGGELSLLPGLDRAPAGFRTLQNGRELAIEELPMQRAALGEIVTGQILDVVRQDGRVVNLYSNAAPLYDEQNRPRGAVGAFLDITDLKKTEEALRESREDLNRAQTVAHIGSWRLNIKRNELLWSEENYRIFGVPEDTSLSYETFLSIIHPDDREYVDRQWQAALRGEPYDIEHRIIVDGSVKWVHEHATLEFDGAGVLLGGFGTTQDITGRKKAEEKLQESEERFRTMANAMPQLAWIARPDGHIYWYNQRWYDYTGTTPEQMEGWGWQIVQDPVILPEVLEKWRTSLATGRTFEMEFPLRGADGNFRSFLTRGVPLKDASGSIVQWFGTNTDITERRQAEEALRRAKDELDLRVQERTAELSQANMSLNSEIRERQRVHEIVVRQSQLLESFFNHTITPLMFLDRHFNIIRVNEAYASAFRQGAQELPGCNYFDIYSHLNLQEIFKSVVATGEPFEAVAMPFTFPSLPELGTTYWNCTLAPLFDKHGETESLVFSLQDVTETQQAHQDLEEAARYTRSLIEASLDPLLTINVNGQIMDTNEATERITGLRREQLIGSDFSNYFTEPEKAKKGYEAVFRKGFVRNYPLEIKDVSGKTRDVLYNATVYRDRGGEIQGVFAAARDITKRKRAENKLRESRERLKFLSSELISAQETERKRIASELHDSIASSLSAAILGLVRAIRELPEGTQGHALITKTIAIVQNTVDETRRMMNLLRPPMLDDLGLLPAITWFLDQYSAIHSGLAINKDIAVEDAEIPEIMKIDIYRIIQEAFTNIAKHSNASTAELSLKKKDDVIELTIADNGQGFNPDAGSAAKRGKSGLGLISMKERAELAGGTMLIQSIAGQGTTVCARWSAGA